MHRGSQPSAAHYLGFVEEEMVDFMRKGFWIVLPFDAVQHLPNLHISPLGVVPQRNRRPRLIVDYTFSGLNAATIKLAPPESMQFGRALDRVLLTVLEAPDAHGPTYLLKVDLSDGFYRIQVRPRDVPKLAIAFPTAPHEPPLVALPLSLPMGWTKSPRDSVPLPKPSPTSPMSIAVPLGTLRPTEWNPSLLASHKSAHTPS